MTDESNTPSQASTSAQKRAGRFQKGQSGNPKGRPRKQSKAPSASPALYPTRKALTAEGQRMIVINDATGRHEITAMQAVARSQQMSAIKGSVFAQREVLNRAMAEESREAQERQERFDTWSTYKEKCTAELKVPRKPGAVPRDYLPHPDDIVLEYSTCTIRFLGALDETSRAHELKIARFRDLAFELAMLHDEPDTQYEDHTVGVYRALSLALTQLLPPRLQSISLQLEQGILLRALGPRAAWEDHLKKLGKEFNISPWLHGSLPPRLPAAVLNLTQKDLRFAESLGRVLDARMPKRLRPQGANAKLSSISGEISSKPSTPDRGV